MVRLLNCWQLEISPAGKIYTTETGQHCSSASQQTTAPPAQEMGAAAAAAAKLLQSCPTLCNPRDGSPPGSTVPGILQEEHWSGLPFPSPMHESEK